jgi:hypothetical protein
MLHGTAVKKKIHGNAVEYMSNYREPPTPTPNPQPSTRTTLLNRSRSWRFLLFPGMNQDLEWRRFANAAVAQRESLAPLDSISVGDFRQCFQQLERRCDRCIHSQGQHLEGDKNFRLCMNILNKGKAKFHPIQATKSQRGSRGIALLFL